MRAIAVALVIGCAPTVRPVALPQLAAPVTPDADFERRVDVLRATLARSKIALDPGPLIEACIGEGQCTRCAVATSADGINPSLIDQVAIAFAGYPSSLLAASAIERVAICRHIRHTHDVQEPAGTADLAAHRMLVSVEQFAGPAPGGWEISDVVHHELFHLFDYAQLGDRLTADPEWGALKPLGFEYRDPIPDGDREPGFVNRYAMTNELEDRASVYQFLIARPTELCALAKDDPIIAAKTTLVWRRITAVAGEAFLRKHAPCVDWIDDDAFGPRRKPSRSRLHMR